MSIEIQSKDVGLDIDDVTADRKDYNSPDWDTVTSGDTAEDALRSLVSMLNSEEIDDVNLYYRAVDTTREIVL